MSLLSTTRRLSAALFVVATLACGAGPAEEAGAALRDAEIDYQELRFLNDQIDLARARDVDRSPEGTPVAELETRLEKSVSEIRAALSAISQDALTLEDLRAFREMEKTVENLSASEPEGDVGEESDVCGFELDEVAAGSAPLDALKRRLYRCFGSAAENLSAAGERLDRLTILHRLTIVEDASQRKQLFYALSPLWHGVNRGNEKDSPYRTLIRLNADELRRNNLAMETEAAATLGIAPETVEEWLVKMLQAWSEANVDQPIEPWDFWRVAGRAATTLDDRVSLDSLRPLNDRFYQAWGADPGALGIVYDLEPRPGKTPVAFATFGRRNRMADGRWIQGEFWVFATYRAGGLGNLAELLHETGHGVHIGAIKTRPAFQDWPDNIVFTEGLADLAAWEIYEPEWQLRYLGASASVGDSLRAKYAGVILDAAWSLFELRMHRDPERDPNQLWTEITGQYLGIRPHSDLSWWALRGQLVELPGYMLNYAIGAVLVAQTRARIRELSTQPADWYALVSEGLFRHGLERPSAQVLRDFLGEEISPEALLRDMSRMAAEQPVRRGSAE